MFHEKYTQNWYGKRHVFYFQNPISDERQVAINAWIATLTNEQWGMVRDLMADAAMEAEHGHEGDE
jgi:hypothetical protein